MQRSRTAGRIRKHSRVKSRPGPVGRERGRHCCWPQALEPRLMLNADLPFPPDLVVGRTLSAYTTESVQNNRVDITYTVYNRQAEPVTGVLVATTLAPGVTFVDASIAPNQNGPELAWSLGTLAAFDRASVTLTVSLADPMPLVLDGGARAFGTLDARRVTDDAPAAALRAGSVPAELLASTPDANIQDPYIQEQAALLDYDPQQIIAYLQQDVGFESYTGSLRGARGTLWSSAGNALDEASLGVALFRAAGIPAQYASGTLSDALAQQLILSMFSASFQAVGHIPAGGEVADPANDPRLLADTREHYWIQADLGAGMQDLDTAFAAGQLGQTFAPLAGTFAEVPDALRHKVTVRMDVETWSQAAAAFGVGGGLSTATVLEQTFNTAELVGRPLTIGHFVSAAAIGAPVFASRTTTYTPYLMLAGDSFDLHDDTIVAGTAYQEVMTNFPLGNQLVTGVFIGIMLRDPQGGVQSFESVFADRIGIAARAGSTGSVTVDPQGPPLITPLHLTTINILPGRQDPTWLARMDAGLQALRDEAAARLLLAVPRGAARSFSTRFRRPCWRHRAGCASRISSRFQMRSPTAWQKAWECERTSMCRGSRSPALYQRRLRPESSRCPKQWICVITACAWLSGRGRPKPSRSPSRWCAACWIRSLRRWSCIRAPPTCRRVPSRRW